MKFAIMAGLLLSLGTAAFGAACAPGTLQTYIGLGSGGCQLGAVTFNGFQTVPGQNAATPINPNLVQVNPGGSFYNPLFTFTLTNPNAASGDLFESIFRLQASGLSLVDASLGLAGFATGDGLLTTVLDVCAGASFTGTQPAGCPNTAGNAINFISGTDQQLTSSAGPLQASFFDIFFDLTLDGGSAGAASLSSATLGVSAVPEPGTNLLLAAGLGALAARKARRNS